jgi:hypothetical protein
MKNRRAKAPLIEACDMALIYFLKGGNFSLKGSQINLHM